MSAPFISATTKRSPKPRGFDSTQLESQPNAAINFQMQTTQHGDLITANGAAVMLRPELEQLPGQQGLNAATRAYGTKAQAMIEELNPAIIQARLWALAKQMLTAPFQTAIDGGIAEAESLQKNKSKWEAPKAVTDPVAYQAFRDEFRPLTKAQKMKALREWPLDAIFAIAHVGPEAYGISEPEWEVALDRIRAFNLTNSDAVRTSFTKSPTLNEVFARGTDPELVRQYVAEGLKQWEERRERLDDAQKHMQQICIVVSVLCGITPDNAFKMLAGIEEENAE